MLEEVELVHLRRAIELSAEAVACGDHPFGAVLVYQGNIIHEAQNTVMTDRDPTQHAENRLVSQAVRKYGVVKLNDCTLYTSTEPCAMCAGAIFWSGVRRIVYACSAGALAEIGSGRFVVESRSLLAAAREKITIVGPVLEEEAVKIHQEFWPTFAST